jgi:uncharacterized protein (UPF0261 family)
MNASAVGLSRDEATAPAADLAHSLLERAGLSVVLYDATGAGGRALEADVLAGKLAGVLDLTTAELAATLLNGPRSGSVDRLTACALRGVPQVIVPGGMDSVWFPELPEWFQEQPSMKVPDGVRIRTNQEENDALGKEIALKASAARGPTAVLIPLGGFSRWSAEGCPLWKPICDGVFAESLRQWVSPQILVRERLGSILSPEFVEEAVAVLREMLH